jgi:hypothetical protein
VTQRVFLHPGPLKTGTTYLQSLLYANRGSFLAQDITIVGDQGSHYRVANELMRRKSLRTTQVPKGAWKRTRTAVLRAPGDVVMSCERYSLFRVEHVRRVLEDLADREVHVVLTLRDLMAVLPARWQEGIKNGGTATWAQFQNRIAEDPARMRKMTRAMSTLEAWAAALPPERIHVVTVPPPSAPRTLLFERFCEALGADPTRLETLEAARANPSMDLATTELIRRVNAQGDVKLSGPAQQSEIKSFLARELPAKKRYRPELTAAVLEVAKGETQALIRRIETGGFPVVGDLNDLTSSTSSAPTGAVVDVNPEELLDVAAVAVAALAQRSWAQGVRLREHAAPRRFKRARRAWRRGRRRRRR